MKNGLKMVCLLLTVSIYWLGGMQVFASEGEEYITISIDATDDNSDLMYSIDSEDPDSFTRSNEFKIPAGTSHTIYVKDAAGNITSQRYEPDPETTADKNDKDPNIDINLEVGGGNSGKENINSKYDYLTDSPAENGEGTVYDQVVTDNSINSQKIFYDITTEEGDVFHLVVDQGNSANNVYLLKQVKNSDLQALAVDDTGTEKEKEKEDSLLQALEAEEAEGEQPEIATEPSKKSSGSNNLIIVIVMAVIGGCFYYFKIYKKKKDTEMDLVDAKNMDDFEAEEEEEVDFEIDEKEKEEYLNRLLAEDDFAGMDDFEEEGEAYIFPVAEDGESDNEKESK